MVTSDNKIRDPYRSDNKYARPKRRTDNVVGIIGPMM